MMISVDMILNREDEEFEIEVFGYEDLGESATRNHPGYADGAIFVYAKLEGKTIKLTPDEIDKAQEALNRAMEYGDYNEWGADDDED